MCTCNQHDYIWHFLQDKNACISHLFSMNRQRPSCCVCFIFDNFLLSVLAQSMFQVRCLQHDLEYEKLQRLQQDTLLQCVSLLS